MATPPTKNEIAGTPTNAEAKAGFGKLWDYVTGLLGATGDAAQAREALGAMSDADGAITTAKLADGALSADTTGRAKMANKFTTYAKIQDVTAGKVLGRDTSGAGAVQELPIAVDSLGNTSIGPNSHGATPTILNINNDNATENTGGIIKFNFGSSNTGYIWNFYDGSDFATQIYGTKAVNFLTGASGGVVGATLDLSGNLKINSGFGAVSTIYGCRSWVNFDGTGANGSKSVRGSGNVSSITKNSTANYTLNFAFAMPDLNYAIDFHASSGASSFASAAILSMSASSINFATYNTSTGSLQDCSNVMLKVTR